MTAPLPHTARSSSPERGHAAPASSSLGRGGSLFAGLGSASAAAHRDFLALSRRAAVTSRRAGGGKPGTYSTASRSMAGLSSYRGGCAVECPGLLLLLELAGASRSGPFSPHSDGSPEGDIYPACAPVQRVGFPSAATKDHAHASDRSLSVVAYATAHLSPRALASMPGARDAGSAWSPKRRAAKPSSQGLDMGAARTQGIVKRRGTASPRLVPHSGQRRLDAAPSAAINIITHLPSESAGGFDGRDAPQTVRLATAGNTLAALEPSGAVAGSATHERRRFSGMMIRSRAHAHAACGSPYLSKPQLAGVSAPALFLRRA